MQGYKEIGELLARAREERRMTVADVAGALHIRPRYITALELGDISLIPGLPYAKGYLTRYASFLSLDRVEIMRRFDMVAQAEQSTHFFMPHSFSHDKRIDFSTAMKFSGLAVLLLLAWAFLLRPSQDVLPVVDPVPERIMETAEPVTVSAETAEHVTCLQPQKGLYPPCIWPVSAPEPSLMYVLKP